jgi:hypothetical protein
MKLLPKSSFLLKCYISQAQSQTALSQKYVLAIFKLFEHLITLLIFLPNEYIFFSNGHFE